MLLKWNTYQDREVLTVEENYSSLTITITGYDSETPVKYTVSREQFVRMITALGGETPTS